MLHVKQAERIKGNELIPFLSLVLDHKELKNLDLHITTVLEMLKIIQSKVIDSDFFFENSVNLSSAIHMWE